MPGVRVSPLGPTLSEKPSEMAVFLHLSLNFVGIYGPRRCNMGIASVSKYVASLNEEQQRHICAFIEFMNAEFPQLSNKISFSMPMWLMEKWNVCGRMTAPDDAAC